MPRRSAAPAAAVLESRGPSRSTRAFGRAGLLALGLAVVAGPAWAASTELVSVGTGVTSRVGGGVQANDRSSQRSISAERRHVALESEATNLVARDSNGLPDVYVRTR